MSNIQINLYKQTNPITGTVVETTRITGEKHGLDNDVRHIVVRVNDPYPYVPGQSAGIIPPGINPKTNKPHILRLYSIASERRGDSGDGKTFSVCVVRHFFDIEATGEKHVAGVCSNYLCDLKVGDQIKVTGPAGKHFVLPEDFKNRDIIFAATGTGIAPFRGMLKEMFDAGFAGRVWLYLGVPYNDTILYDNEFKAWQAKHKNFFYVTAISRGEELNPIPDLVPTRQNKIYVQVRMYQDREKLKEAFKKPDSLLYLCGLKGMEGGIFPIVDKIGQEIGHTDGSFSEFLKKQNRLLVEIY